MTVAAVLVVGLIFGSFLGMCIHRIPRGQYYTFSDEELDLMGEELPPPVKFNDPPRSQCPSCKKQLLWWHNIPVISWLLLRGRCNFCGASISSRYAFVELLTGFFALLTYYRYCITPTAALIFLFCCALIVITFIDYDYYIIPDLVSRPGTALGVATAVVNQFYPIFSPPVVQGIEECLWGLLYGGGFLYAVAWAYLKLRKKDGLGLGDVKLLFMTGAFFGGPCAIYTIFIGSLVGSVVGISLVVIGKRKMAHYLPFGPYLAFGTVAYLFVNPNDVAPYLDPMVELLVQLFGYDSTVVEISRAGL